MGARAPATTRTDGSAGPPHPARVFAPWPLADRPPRSARRSAAAAPARPALAPHRVAPNPWRRARVAPWPATARAPERPHRSGATRRDPAPEPGPARPARAGRKTDQRGVIETGLATPPPALASRAARVAWPSAPPGTDRRGPRRSVPRGASQAWRSERPRAPGLGPAPGRANPQPCRDGARIAADARAVRDPWPRAVTRADGAGARTSCRAPLRGPGRGWRAVQFEFSSKRSPRPGTGWARSA